MMRSLVLGFCLIAVLACSPVGTERDLSDSPSGAFPPSPIVDDPISTTFIYRLDKAGEKIYRASLDPATGELYEHDATSLPSGSKPNSFAFSVDKKYLFVSAFGTGSIESYEVDQVSGELTWTRSTNTFHFPAARVHIDPQGEYLYTIENSNIQGQSGGYLVIYELSNDIPTALHHLSLGLEGTQITGDSSGDYYFVGNANSGVVAIGIDRSGAFPVPSKSSISGTFIYAFAFHDPTQLLFTANYINGDFNDVLAFDSSTLGLSLDEKLDGGQIVPFEDIEVHNSGNSLYLLSNYNAKVKAFELSSTPTDITPLNTVSLTSGCAPKVMTFADGGDFLITACTDSSGQTFIMKIEADGSLTLKATSVRTGMKTVDILAVTL